ncbi:MAG TPA: hypothetical protein ENJ37_08635 [Deltaproteobacteria bacterium]|nr:hypothetical protein [Deltaproteobacteria bacterium]
MEKTFSGEGSLAASAGQAVLLVAVACAMIVIAYGIEAVAPGVHDAFHDFRHTIGMPCH